MPASNGLPSELSFAGTPLGVLAENLLLLRYAEYEGHLHRLISVLKMRFSDFDRALYEYTMENDQGVRIAGPVARAEGLLTGLARPIAATTGEDPRISDGGR